MNTAFCTARTRPDRRPGASGGGFALLEALVALLLFSIGILGLLGLQARAISSESDAQDRNRAALIADRCASQMQLRANNLTRADVATTVQGLCQSPAWLAYMSDPSQTGSGLSGAAITVGSANWPSPLPLPSSAGGPTFVPVWFAITVTWNAPARPVAMGAGTNTALPLAR